MKITNLELREIHTEIPIVTGGTYQINVRRALLVRISTDTGLVSEICAGNQPDYEPEMKAMLRGALRQRIIGADPMRTLDIWKDIAATATGTYRDQTMRALSFLDIGLWDLKGLATGQPVWKLLGGRNPRQPIISIGGYYETASDEAGIRAEIAELKRAGMGGVKFKVGAKSLEVDAERVRLARAAAGPDFILVVDSNTAWTPRDAVRFAEMIKPYNPAWLEEPVRRQNMYRGLREVRLKTGVRVAAGQSEHSVYDCHELIAGECVDVINIIVTRGGGITGWTMLAAAAEFADIDMAQVAEPGIGMHLMAGIANPTCVECYAQESRDPFWAKLYRDAPVASGGFIEAPDRPGLGLTLDPDAVESYAIEPWS